MKVLLDLMRTEALLRNLMGARVLLERGLSSQETSNKGSILITLLSLFIIFHFRVISFQLVTNLSCL